MTILTHAVVAGLVGGQSPNLIAASLGGYLSHFVLDLVPHNDYFYFYWEGQENPYLTWASKITLLATGLYFLIALGTLSKFAFSSWLVGSLFGILPDLMTGFNVTFRQKRDRLDRFHELIHKRPSLGELFHNLFSGGPRVDRTEKLTTNLKVMRFSFWARFGWGVEILLELAILLSSLKIILKN